MTHKVKPVRLVKHVRLEKKRVRDIKPGEIFFINGDGYVMLNPAREDDKSMASVLLVESSHIPGLENINCTINNGEFVHVRAEDYVEKNREKSANGTEG